MGSWPWGCARVSRRVFCVVVMLAVLAGPAGAEPAPVLRVGTSDDYAPFSLRGEGFDVDVARALARDLGATILWVPFRWPELSAAIASGSFDVAMSGITWRPERAVVGWMTRAVAQGGPCVVGNPGAAVIAVNRGGVLESWARRRHPMQSVIAVDDNLSLPMLLEGGAAGAYVTDSFEIGSRPPKSKEAPVRCEPWRDRKVYWVAPQRAADLGPRIDRWLVENEPLVDKLRVKWLGRSAERTEIDALVDELARRMALMPAVGSWKRTHDMPIEDRKREKDVLARAALTAREAGLDIGSFSEVFLLQIDLAKRVEQRSEMDEPALDLEREIRPMLGRIGDRIVASLAAVAPIDPATLPMDRLAPLGELLEADELALLRSKLIEVRRAKR